MKFPTICDECAEIFHDLTADGGVRSEGILFCHHASAGHSMAAGVFAMTVPWSDGSINVTICYPCSLENMKVLAAGRRAALDKLAAEILPDSDPVLQ